MESDEADVEPSVPRRSRPWGRIIGGVIVVVALVAGLTYVTTRDNGGGKGDNSPSAWDPRIVDLVHFVERDRGLTFEHPVKSEFLADADFRKKVTDNGALTKKDKAEIHHYEGVFRALGLIEGNVDLLKELNQLSGAAVIGLYDPKTKIIYIRGGAITPTMRPTIVHELTHALQDQRYGLDLDLKPSGADTAFTALVEADAVRIQDDYKKTLSDAEQRAIAASDAQEASSADLKGVPPILTELFEMPYVLGPPFVQAIIRKNGKAGVDKAFVDKPTTEEQIAEPQEYLIGDKASKVATPKLEPGEKKFGDPDDFGMISLLLVLGERLPFPQAWAAADGWKGDASITYREKGKDCIRVRTQVDTSHDADELEAAVRAWGQGLSTTTKRVRDDTIEFASCDPGTAATSNAQSGRPRTFDLLALRSELVSTFENEKFPPSMAACVTDDVIRSHDPAKLLELNSIQDANDPRIRTIQRDVATSVRKCQG